MVRQIMWFGFFLRFVVATWNGFFGPSFGADLDAVSFHLQAVAYAKNLEFGEFHMGWIYSYVLGAFYAVTGSSLFLGSLLSCTAWLASAKFLARSMRLLSFDAPAARRAMFLYAVLPSSLMFTSVTLREPFQLMFVNLAIYSSLKIYLSKDPRYWFFMALAVVGMGVLHGGLFAFGLFIIVATLALLMLRGRAGMSPVRIAIIAPFAVLIGIYGLSLFGAVSYNLNDGLSSAIESYQQGGLNTVARTNYKTAVEISGIGGLLLFLPVSLFQYLFEPMPWHVSGVSDIPVLVENVMRAWLIWRAWRGLWTVEGEAKRAGLFLLLSYFVLELLWSLGTINWGTAARHHVPGVGLLLMASLAYSRASAVRRKSGWAKSRAA
jgi:hypothetical protein